MTPPPPGTNQASGAVQSPGPIQVHRRVLNVEDAPSNPEDGVAADGAGTVVWYLSGPGVCRPAVYHLDDRAGVWVRGAPCESVVDGGLVVQPTWGGRVEVRLVHLKLASFGPADPESNEHATDPAADSAAWTINFRRV